MPVETLKNQKGGVLRIVLIILGVLVLVGVFALGVGLWMIHSWLHSEDFKQMVQKQTSSALGAEVIIDDVQFSWKDGISLRTMRIPNTTPHDQEDFFSLVQGQITPSWFSLLGNSPTLELVELKGPIIRLRQTPNGNFHLPFVFQEKATSDQGISLFINRLSLTDGKIKAFAADRSPLFTLEGTSLNQWVALNHSTVKLEGHMGIRRLVVGPTFTLDSLASPLKFTAGVLEFPGISGACYGGSATGNLTVDFNQTEPTFRLQATLSEVDVPTMLSAFESDPQLILGKMRVEVDTQGRLSEPKALTGPGTLRIAPAHMSKFKSLQLLGTLLGISILRDGNMESIEAEFDLGNETIQMKRLWIQSPNVTIKLEGTIGFDQKLDLRGDLEVAPDLLSLIKPLASQILKRRDGGAVGTRLLVRGTVAAPEIQLDGNWITENMTEDSLNQLFNRGEELIKPLQEGLQRTIDEGIRSIFGP